MNEMNKQKQQLINECKEYWRRMENHNHQTGAGRHMPRAKVACAELNAWLKITTFVGLENISDHLPDELSLPCMCIQNVIRIKSLNGYSDHDVVEGFVVSENNDEIYLMRHIVFHKDGKYIDPTPNIYDWPIKLAVLEKPIFDIKKWKISAIGFLKETNMVEFLAVNADVLAAVPLQELNSFSVSDLEKKVANITTRFSNIDMHNSYR